MQKPVVLEFRNGSYFTSPHADNGGPLDKALRFESEAQAQQYFEAYPWVWLNGGMLTHQRRCVPTKST